MTCITRGGILNPPKNEWGVVVKNPHPLGPCIFPQNLFVGPNV